MFCSNCGKAIRADDHYCEYCGVAHNRGGSSEKRDVITNTDSSDTNIDISKQTYPKWVFVVVVAVIVVGIAYFNYDKSNQKQILDNSTVQETDQGNEKPSIDPVSQADYTEGYKAGYVDGRASNGQLGDSYAEPATEERKEAYVLGYLEGFLKGCREGGFDCSEVERALIQENQTNTVNLIPNSVN